MPGFRFDFGAGSALAFANGPVPEPMAASKAFALTGI